MVFLSTINVVNVITPALNIIETKENGPIRIVKQSKETKTAKESVLTVYKPMQLCVECKQSIETAINSEMTKDLSDSKISRVYVQANYENDKIIQKIIRLLKENKSSVLSRLPPPWMEMFSLFTLNSQNLIFMD